MLIGTVIGVLASAFFSWLITHSYYRRSLRSQASEASGQIAAILGLAEANRQAARELLLQRRVEETLQDYRRAGTPEPTIDTYTDLTNEEKATLLDRVVLRKKGRLPRTNKYRVALRAGGENEP